MDAEAALRAHLGNNFYPYVGREEGLPKSGRQAQIDMEERIRQRELKLLERQHARRLEAEQFQRKCKLIDAQQQALAEQERQFHLLVEVICAVYGVTWGQILEENRHEDVGMPRRHLMFAAKEYLGMGWSHIGRLTSRNHSSVWSGHARGKELIQGTELDAKVLALLAQVKRALDPEIPSS